MLNVTKLKNTLTEYIFGSMVLRVKVLIVYFLN